MVIFRDAGQQQPHYAQRNNHALSSCVSFVS